MFSKFFSATLEIMNPIRKPQDEGGELIANLSIRAVMTHDMAEDLSPEIVTFLESDSSFKSITMDNPANGLILDIWHEEQNPEEDQPYLCLSDLSTKKFKLNRDADAHCVILHLPLKTAPVNEAQSIQLLHCLGCQIKAKIDFVQQELNFDGAIEQAQQDNDAFAEEEDDAE